TALMLAALNGYQEVVEYLVEHGADVNAQDEEGRNVFMYATDPKIVDYLVKAYKATQAYAKLDQYRKNLLRH
ncbi:MAG: ankyrin repeat domain-containing protein, partial [Candidatus Micrarchaeia archaeon]